MEKLVLKRQWSLISKRLEVLYVLELYPLLAARTEGILESDMMKCAVSASEMLQRDALSVQWVQGHNSSSENNGRVKISS